MRTIGATIGSFTRPNWFVMAWLGLLLVGCGAAPTSSPSPTSNASPTSSPSPTNSPRATSRPSPTRSSMPTSSPAPTSSSRATANPSPPITGQPSDALVMHAREQVARHLNIAPEAVTLQSATPQEWSTSALGCPVPGQAYLQVITPGYLLIFTANNQQYEIHTNDRSSTLILCLNGQPTRLDSTP